jgi:hypothetical protein
MLNNYCIRVLCKDSRPSFLPPRFMGLKMEKRLCLHDKAAVPVLRKQVFPRVFQ